VRAATAGHYTRTPRRTRPHRAALESGDASLRRAPMPASTPPPGGGPEPAPAAPSLYDEDHDHDFSPLLDLLQRFPDLFLKEVLERLEPTARTSLAGAGSAFLDVVFPRSIFPFGLPARAETTGDAVRVFKLVHFLGSIERLAWAKANGCPWTVDTCRYAALGGHLEALRWMRELGCPWDARTSYGAAEGGHLAVLRWAREHGCPWSVWTGRYAAWYGHLNVLQLARENDCPWDEETCYGAAMEGQLQILQWARAHGCPWIKLMCEASRDHPETLALVRQQPE